MDNAQSQLTEKIAAANNILVTVNKNPSVDQLAACIGLTLLINKLNKHATAVFSGEVPSTIEFLQPEGTIEKNTDSLRDFIIALDKSKADKLRYKVEDQLVRIFITPYRTSITENDLEFSQGDFNVDLVIGLGVDEQSSLDDAITAHGRILHDATVASISVAKEGGLGSINWHQPAASSLCEAIVDLSHSIGENLLDGQISTALLTGIIAETERFRNAKTSPVTMSLSAELLRAGADQQLVANKLEVVEEPVPAPAAIEAPQPQSNPVAASELIEDTPPPAVSNDGTLEINHTVEEEEQPEQPVEEPIDAPAEAPGVTDQQEETEPLSNEPPAPDPVTVDPPSTGVVLSPGSKLVLDPPMLGGTLTANSHPEQLEAAIDPLGLSTEPAAPLLHREAVPTVEAEAAVPPQPLPPSPPSTPILTGFTPPPPAWVPPPDNPMDAFQQTVDPLPEATQQNATASTAPVEPVPDVSEPVVPVATASDQDLEEAREQVLNALGPTMETPAAFNAQPLGDIISHDDESSPSNKPASTEVSPSFIEALQQNIPATPPSADSVVTLDSGLTLPTAAQPAVVQPETAVPPAAPAVPPPLPYQFEPAPDELQPPLS